MQPRNLRFPDEQMTAIKSYCDKERMTVSTFCRMAVAEKLSRDNSFEDRLAATFAAFRNEQQVLLAMVDCLVLALFTCLPEPQPDTLNNARQNALTRREKFRLAVAASLNGNSKGVTA